VAPAATPPVTLVMLAAARDYENFLLIPDYSQVISHMPDIFSINPV